MEFRRGAPLRLSILLLLAWAGGAHAGTLSTVAPLGASLGVVVQITGTGFSTTAASNEVTFGASAPVAATSIVTINATQGLRRIAVRVPDGLPAGTAAIRVVNRDTGEASTGRSLEVVTIGVTPSTAARGSTVELLVEGSANAQFSAGTTRVGLGAGVTVSSVVVDSARRLRATLTVAPDAAAGPRDVGVFAATQTLLARAALTITDGAPQNQAPSVTAVAQPDSITLPTTQVTLAGTAQDDGLPAGGTLSYAWTVASGPGPVSFGTPGAATTTATFSVAGAYSLRLTVSDGDLSGTALASVTVNPRPNAPPTVSAGPDRTLQRPASALQITGAVDDDGEPAGSTLQIAWTQVSGPAGVTFAPANAATTLATFPGVGTYELRLSASDGALSASDTVMVVVEPAANAAPTVEAGPDRQIRLPENAVTLTAAASDDGFPEGSTLTFQWSQTAGPAQAQLASPGSASTGATFASAGTYTFQVLVGDGELSATDAVSVVVLPPAVTNTAPVVTPTATPAQITLPTNSVALAGGVVDDGLPAGGVVTYRWTRVSGPLGVAFAAETARDTSVQFSEAGTFVLRLTVNDGALEGSGTVTVVVGAAPPPPPPPPPPTNLAPVVTASASPAQITLPVSSVSLTGSAQDDGLPGGALGYAWSKQSGPGTVSFGNANAGNTTATFSASGTYELRLEVNDGELTGSAPVSVTVNPAPPPPPPTNEAPVVTASASPSTVTLPANVVDLSGSASDDGRPGGGLSFRWSTQTGPAPVVFDAPDSPSTRARFTTAGTYQLRLLVSDGQDAASRLVAVTVNPGAPPPPVNRAPTARPGGPYAGDAGSPVALSGRASSDPEGDALTYAWDFGDGTQGSGPAPVHTFPGADTFTVTLTVTDPSGASHVATTTAAIGPAADRAPPAVTLVAPAEALPGAEVPVTAEAADNVSVRDVTFTVNGAAPQTLTAPPFVRTVTVPAVAAPGTLITVRATATDPSNNAGSAERQIRVVAAPDTTPPEVSLVAPDTASPGQHVPLTAVATDAVGVASVRFLEGVTTLGTDFQSPYGVTVTIPATTTPGALLVYTARATDFAGNVADASATVTVVAAPDTTPPTLSLSVPASVPEGGTFDVEATAQDAGGVASVSFTVDDVPAGTAIAAPYRARIAVPSSRGPGSVLSIAATATDTSSLTASATATTVVVGATAGLGLVTGEVYDDTTGLPIAGATVRSVTDAGRTATTDARGRYALALPSGPARVLVDRAGFTQVERSVVVPDRGAVEALDARLTPLGSLTTIAAALGGQAGGERARATIPSGALAADAPVRVTRVGPQGLRGELPFGWSPIAVADLRVDSQAALAAPVTLALPDEFGVADGTPLTVAAWDATAGAWRVLGTATRQGATLSTEVASAGQVAWLIGDVVPVAPPAQVAGGLLTGVTPPALAVDAAVTVSPDPKIAVYDPQFRADVSAALITSEALSSGLVLRARLVERYDFVDRPRIGPDPFTHDFVFYQFPGQPQAPAASFVVSPSLVFEAAALKEGVISVEMLAGSGAELTLIGRDGGRAVAPTGESFTLAADVTFADVAVRLERLLVEALGLELPPVIEPLGAVTLSLGGAGLAQSGVLAIARPAALVDDTGLVLARLVDVLGATRLEFVALGRIAGDQIVSDTAVAGLATPLPGVREGGRYVFLRIGAPSGFVTGVVRDGANAPAPGRLVTTSSLPLVSLSAATTGAYVVPALAGTNEVAATDPATFDAVLASVGVTAGGIARRDLRILPLAPRVTSVTPAVGAIDVALGAPVVVTFSEPVAPATIGALVVETSEGAAVGGAVALTDGNRIATFRASDALLPMTGYRVRVTTSLTDTTGRALEAEFASAFTTIDTAPRPPPPAGTISATVPFTGRTTVRASQGTAGLRDTVRIHNLTTKTFQVALVAPDGSFEAALDARFSDRLRIGITTTAGVETTIDLPRFVQENPDGSISSTVDAAGGTLTGPNGVQVDVPAGAFPDGAIVTVQSVSEAEFPVKLTARQRADLKFSGGIRLDFHGAVPTRYLDLSLPAAADDTFDDRWVVTEVRTIDGRPAMVVADTARVIDGRVKTSSPPCPGALAAATYGFVKGLKPIGLSYGRFVDPAVTSSLQQALNIAVGIPGAGFQAWAIAQDLQRAQEGTCMPSLAGRVTVTPNTQNVVIDAGVLTPADRQVIVRNAATGQTFYYPRNVVEFRRSLFARTADVITVGLQTEEGEVTIPFTRRTLVANETTEIHVDMDAIAVPAQAVVIRNVTRGEDTVVPLAQVDVTVPVSGGGNAADYAVQVADAAGTARTVPFTLESPNGPGRLLARALPLTIDPGTETVIRNTTTGASIPVPNDVIVAGRGGFAFGFDGDFANSFAVVVTYTDASRLPEVYNVPKMRLVVSSPTTGAVVRTYDAPVPPQDEPFNLGAISGDKTRPFVIGTPDNLSFFDPQGSLSFTFSEGLDRESALANVTLVDADGNEVEIEVRLSQLNTVLTIVPRSPLKLGATYTVKLDEVTDASGNAVTGPVFVVKTFQPRRIGPAFLPGHTFPVTGITTWRREVEGRTRTFAAGTKRSGGFPDPNLALFDLTDADAPAQVGQDNLGGPSFTTKRSAVATDVVDLPITAVVSVGQTENPCGGGTTFSGDLLVASRDSTSPGGGFTAGVTFYDVTDPSVPCVLGGKAIVSNLPGLARHTIQSFGFAGGVGLLRHEQGILAFVAVERVGLFSVDVGKWIYKDIAVDDFRRDPYVPGDYRRVEVAGNRVIAMSRSTATIDVFDPALAQLQSFPVQFEDELIDMDYVEAFQIDLNEDGVIDGNELRNLVFVGGTRGLSVVDVTDLNNVEQRAFVPLAQRVASVKADVHNRRVVLSAFDPAVAENTDERIYLLDFSTPKSLIPADADGDGDDDRIVWKSPPGLYSQGGGRLLALDETRGLFYVASGDFGKGNPPGVDTWALDSLCCDVRIDMLREVTAGGPEGSGDQLIKAEIAVLSKGIAQGLTNALNGTEKLPACGVEVAPPGQPATISILEQGSGSCIWKENPTSACSDNYQPGLSDHDYEVFMPEAYFQGTVGERKADCVVKHLARIFTAEDGTPIEFDVDGQKIRFDDITFFPFRKEGFDNALIDILPPQNKDGDTLGDLGLGRQSLLLLWLLGGEYITVPGYNVQGPPLAAILKKLKKETKIPELEGYEWATLQNFNLYKTAAFVRVRGASNATSAFHDLFIKQLHDAGKAGIRTIFGRLIADPRTNAFAYQVRRAPNPDDVVPLDADERDHPVYSQNACLKIEDDNPASWTPKPCKGFEEYIASVAARTITELNLDLFTPNEILEVVHKMWRVKGDVQLPTRKDVRDDTSADEFVALVANTITTAFDQTRPAYERGMATDPRAGQRTTNLTTALQLLAKKKKASLHVVPRVANAGFRAAEGVPMVMWRGIGNQATRVLPKTSTPGLPISLGGGEVRYMANTKEIRTQESFEVEDADRNLADLSDYDSDYYGDQFLLGDKDDAQVNPLVDQDAERGVARWVAFTLDLDLPQRVVREGNRQNNYDGFYYYVLDRQNPGPPGGTGGKVPLPVPDDGSLLDPDEECDPAPSIEVSQTMTVDGIEYGGEEVVLVPLFKDVHLELEVSNLGEAELGGVQACSSLTGGCYEFGTLAPGETQTFPVTWTAPGESGQRAARVVASSADGGTRLGNTMTVVIGCERYTIVSPDPDPNPAERARVMQGGTAYRYYRVVRRDSVDEPAPIDVSVDVEVTSTNGDYFEFNFAVDEEGWIGLPGATNPETGEQEFLRGIAIPIPIDSPVGTVFTVKAVTVDPGSACVSDVTWQVEAAERTFQGVLSAGAGIRVSGKLFKIVEIAGKAGYGLEATIDTNAAGVDKQIQLATTRSIGIEAGVKWDNKPPVQAGVEATGGQAAASALRGAEIAAQDKYVFPVPLSSEAEIALIAAALEPVVGEVISVGVPGGPFIASALSLLLNDPFSTERYRLSTAAQLQVTQEYTANVTGFKFSLGRVDDVQSDSRLSIDLEANAALKGAVVLTAETTRDEPRTTTVSLEHRADLNYKEGFDVGLAGITNLKLVENLRKWLEFIDKYFKLQQAGSWIESVKFEVPINQQTGAYDRIVMTLLEKKKYGINVLGDQWVDMGDNLRRSVAYTIKIDTPEKRSAVFERLLFLGGLLSLSSNVPGAILFTAEQIGKEIAGLVALADVFESSVEDGKSFKYPLGISDLLERIKGNGTGGGGTGGGGTGGGSSPTFGGVESEIKMDGSTKYVTGRGVVLKGQQYFLERYPEKDPNIPTSGPEKLVGLLSQTKKIWDNIKFGYKSASKWLDDQFKDIKIEFSPSGATLEYDATGDPGEVDLMGFQYRAVGADQAWPFMLPVSVAGRADVPHNGIGGFFSLFPYRKALVRPATLTIRWLDPEVAGLDESSIRIYEWNDAEGEWQLLGGTVNAAENSVSVQITRFGMFTAAPAMPVGEPTVLATITSPGSGGQPTRATFTSETVSLNAGGPVPDGTLFTVYITTGTGDDPVSIGTILDADLDPALEGVQVASQGGVVRFTAEFPAALGDGKVLMWSARGGTVFVDQDLLLAPPQP